MAVNENKEVSKILEVELQKATQMPDGILTALLISIITLKDLKAAPLLVLLANKEASMNKFNRVASQENIGVRNMLFFCDQLTVNLIAN